MNECKPCGGQFWFRLLQYEQLKRQVENLALDSARYDDPPPSESMFQQLDFLQGQLAAMQGANPN